MDRNVLLLAEYGVLNGGERSFLAVVDQLVAAGWKLRASVPEHTEFAAEFHRRGIPVYDWEVCDAHQKRKSQAQLRQQLSRLIDSVQPDLIHCNSLSTSRLAGPVVTAAGIPAIGYLRDIVRLSQTAVGDINQLDRVVAVSRATRQWHLQQGLDPSRSCVIHNGVDTDRFCPATHPAADGQPNALMLRRSLGLADDDRVLLFVGQIGMRKGIDVLIRAFAILAQEDPRLHLWIVGERHSVKQEAVDYEVSARQALEGQPAQARIHWLGRRTDVDCLMRVASILVHPARQEPLGRVLLEAAASGLPIVTTDVGGSSEILASAALTECLVPVDDSDAVASQVRRLLQSPALWLATSRELREMAVSRFSVARCASELGAVYQEALGRTP